MYREQEDSHLEWPEHTRFKREHRCARLLETLFEDRHHVTSATFHPSIQGMYQSRFRGQQLNRPLGRRNSRDTFQRCVTIFFAVNLPFYAVIPQTFHHITGALSVYQCSSRVGYFLHNFAPSAPQDLLMVTVLIHSGEKTIP